MDHSILKFYSGVHNRDTDENIPKDAAQDAKNFVTKDGKAVLSYGTLLIGDRGLVGKIYAEHFGYKRNGTKVHYRKAGTKIQFLNGTTWTNIITGLTEAAEYTFNSYSTLAGAFTIATGVDGIYKFNNDSPGSYLSLYNVAKNDKGYSLIDKGRMLMWNLSNASKTTLKQSWIDAQDGTVYTTVSGEVLGGFGDTTYNGFLAERAVAASGTLTSTGVNVADAETVTIGATVYRFKTVMTQAYDVQIGASAAITLANLKKAINANGVAGTNYFAGTLVHPSVRGVTLTATTLLVRAIASGTAGNSIATTETSGELSWGAVTLTGGAATGTRNVFAIVISGTTGGGVETFTDNKDGTLTGSLGGTGTINYITGAYSVTFSGVTTSGNVTADYQWEDSNIKGITDFTFSATRVAGEGNRITQDIGGDKIVNVLVGQDGAYYSLKEQSAYRLEISADDITFTNKVYRRDLGTSFLRASISTSKGIAFINTANPEKPVFTILQKNVLDAVEPVTMFDHFDFSKFDFSDCALDTFDRFIAVMCKSIDADNNDRILLCNPANPVLDRSGNTAYVQTVDITGFSARMLVKDGGNVYGGSPFSENIFQLFTGFDDDSQPIENFWTSKGETYKSENLKKYRKQRFAGLTSVDQVVKVEVDYDGAGFTQIGTIRGDASYVDSGSPQTIGTNMIGEAPVGGDSTETVYPYFMEIKLTHQPKFRKRTFKLTAQEIGYFDFATSLDHDILVFEQRIPKRYRQKQNVSLSGAAVDQ